MPIEAGGRTIKLGDFTTVTRGYEDPPTYTIRHNGQDVLMIGVVMTEDGNVVELGRAMEGTIAKIQSELPYGVELERVADQPEVVKDAVWEFERSLLEALVIVLAVSLVSLGWRTGLVVAASVPLVLGLVAIIMLAMGWNLERVSLGSLIIALGLLVDDSIISLETMVVKMESGWDRVKAACFSYKATAMPRLTGALVTVAGFMPIGFSKSTTGEYAGGIFWIVGIAVVFSWVVSGLFTPYLAVKMLPETFKGHEHGKDPYDTPFYRKLRKLIDVALERRWLVIGVTAAALAMALLGMKLVPQQFFPNSSRPEILIDLRVKEGASFAATTEQVKKLEAILAKDQDVRFFTAYTGGGGPRFVLSINPELPNPGYAQFIVMTKDLEARERVRSRLMAMAPEKFPDAWVRVTRLELGPPVGFPVQFRVVGPDTQKVRAIAREVEQVVASSDKVRDVQLDWYDPVRALRVDLDQDKARALGLTAGGHPARHPHRDERCPAVAAARARGPDRHRRSRRARRAARPRDAEERERLHASRNRGAPFPGRPRDLRARRAGALAAQPRHGDHRARRREGRRAGRVGHEGDRAAPEGHRGEAARRLSHRRGRRGRGERQGEQRAAGRGAGNALTVLLILMLQLQNFTRMWMVFATAPLGLIGVVAGLLLFHAPLGFVAILGIVALGGMIMRNAVILIDQVQTEMDQGQRSMDRGRRCRGAPDASGGSHRRRDSARDGPAHAKRVLGPDGHRDHGRPHRRDAAHHLLRAGSLCGVLCGPARTGGRCDRDARSRDVRHGTDARRLVNDRGRRDHERTKGMTWARCTNRLRCTGRVAPRTRSTNGFLQMAEMTLIPRTSRSRCTGNVVADARKQK